MSHYCYKQIISLLMAKSRVFALAGFARFFDLEKYMYSLEKH